MRRRTWLLALLAGAFLAGCLSGGDQPRGEEESVQVDPYSDAGVPGTGGVANGTGGPKCIATTTGEELQGNGTGPCPQGQYPSTG